MIAERDVTQVDATMEKLIGMCKRLVELGQTHDKEAVPRRPLIVAMMTFAVSLIMPSSLMVDCLLENDDQSSVEED